METFLRKTITTILFVIYSAALITILFAVPVFLNVWHVVVVDNHNMAPTISAGSFVIGVKTKTSSLNSGDIIVMNTSIMNKATIDRVKTVTKNKEGQYSFQTQGDNNALPVLQSYVAGTYSYKLFLTVPFLGLIISLMSNIRISIIFLIGIGILLWVYVFKLHRKETYVSEYSGQEENSYFVSNIELLQEIFFKQGKTLSVWNKKTFHDKKIIRQQNRQQKWQQKQNKIQLPVSINKVKESKHG